MQNKANHISTLFRPEIVLISLGILIGLSLCVLIPYGAGFDEETGMVRTFDISGLHFIPNVSKYTPSEFYTLSYQRRYFQSPAFDLFSKENFTKKIDWNNMADGKTITSYFPANYLLQAFVAGIGLRVFNGPIIPVVILMRLIGFAFYLFCCYQTIRLLPTGKWLFLVVAFLPMALLQEATITADGFTIASSFLFIGEVLHVYFNDEKTIKVKDSWGIAIAAVLVGCAKSGTILLLLLWLLLVSHKHESKTGKWIVLSGILLAVFISMTWMLLINFNQKVLSDESTLSSQIKMVLQNFPDFLKGYVTGIAASIPNYYKNWIGSYGYWDGKVPPIIFILYPLAIVGALFSEEKAFSNRRKGRIFLFLVGFLGIFMATLYNFVGFYTPGEQTIDRVGRYFIPFIPLLLFAFSGLFTVNANRRKFLQISVLALVLGFVGFYSFGLYRTYYTKCVYPLSVDHTCELPVYKNLDIKNPPIAALEGNTVIRQSFVPECDQVNAIQFMLGSNGVSQNDRGILIISNDQKQQITKQSFSISNVNDKYLNIPVKLESIKNETIWVELFLESTDITGARIDFLERADSAIYPQGKLLIDRVEQDADLVFQYACVNP